jgi:hypothetical protein
LAFVVIDTSVGRAGRVLRFRPHCGGASCAFVSA